MAYNNGNIISSIKLPDGTNYNLHATKADRIIETNKNLEQKFWTGTFAEYDAIESKDNDTIYIVTDDEEYLNAQSDWFINDPNDPAYIKNRPFYETDPVETVILEETTVTVEEEYAGLTLRQQFTPGTTYTICFNGNEYECIAWDGYNNSVCIGNGDIYGGEGLGGDEPFSIDTHSDGEAYINVTEPGTYTVSIVGLITEVIEIPKKYMPIKNIRDGKGEFSVAEGYYTTASGNWGAHAEGIYTTASGENSHAEGAYTTAFGEASHAEGKGGIYDRGSIFLTGEANSTRYSYTTNFDDELVGLYIYHNGAFFNIVEHNVEENTVVLNRTLSEDSDINNGEMYIVYVSSIASGEASHVEGDGTVAFGWASHAEGAGTEASGWASHAEGHRTTASSDFQHVQGVNNIPDEETQYAHIVGNGDLEDFQSNAHTLDWNGNAWFAGDVYVGSTSGVNRDEGSKKLVTVDEMNAAIQAAIEAAFANIAKAEESEF